MTTILGFPEFTIKYLIAYSSINLICLVLTIVSLYHTVYGIVKVPHLKFIRKIMLSSILINISDTAWKWVECNVLKIDIESAYTINTMYFLGMQIMALYVFLHFYSSINDITIKPSVYAYISIPCVIVCILNLTDIIHKTLFYITDDIKYIRGDLYVIEYILPGLYLIVLAINIIIVFLRSKKSGHHMHLYSRTTVTVPIAIGLFGFAGMFFSTIPLITVAASFSMMFYYTQMLEEFVTIDPVTEIGNITDFNQEIEKRVAIENVENRDDLYIILLEVINLTLINDKYGYIEGDHMLRRVSSILKRKTITGDALNVYVSRFKGDTFALIVNSSDDYDIKEYCMSIQNKISRSDVIHNVSYVTEIEYAYTKYEKGLTVKQFIENAERELALNKYINNKTISIEDK